MQFKTIGTFITPSNGVNIYIIRTFFSPLLHIDRVGKKMYTNAETITGRATSRLVRRESACAVA